MFNATDVTEEFAYKGLEQYGIPDGEIQQPTMGEVRKFRDQITAAQRRVCGIDIDTPITEQSNEELQKALDALTPEQRDQLNDDSLDIVAEICKGRPTRDQILALPAPLQFSFCRWLQVLLSPLF